jgi:hypothetical protein
MLYGRNAACPGRAPDAALRRPSSGSAPAPRQTSPYQGRWQMPQGGPSVLARSSQVATTLSVRSGGWMSCRSGRTVPSPMSRGPACIGHQFPASAATCIASGRIGTPLVRVSKVHRGRTTVRPSSWYLLGGSELSSNQPSVRQIVPPLASGNVSELVDPTPGSLTRIPWNDASFSI